VLLSRRFKACRPDDGEYRVDALGSEAPKYGSSVEVFAAQEDTIESMAKATQPRLSETRFGIS